MSDNLCGLQFGERSPEITNLVKALMAFRRKCPKIRGTRKNDITGGKYANLGDIESVVTPILLDCGLVITQLLSAESFDVTCKTVLIHESGEYIASSLTITAHDRKTGAPSAKPMQVKAAVSYARGSGMSGILGLTFEEDRAETRDRRPPPPNPPPRDNRPRPPQDNRPPAPPPPPPPAPKAPEPPKEPGKAAFYDRTTPGHLDFLSAWFKKHDIPPHLYQEIESRLHCKPWGELTRIAKKVMEETNGQGQGAGNGS